MGRIKTTFIKNVGQELFQSHSEEFSTEFSKNKEVVNKFLIVKSKKMRNIIAGYITSLKRQEI
jgi:small subunit ribosomal protein S17e